MCDRTGSIFCNSSGPFSEVNDCNKLIWFEFISIALLFSNVLSYGCS
jgi:hypothetical protein